MYISEKANRVVDFYTCFINSKKIKMSLNCFKGFEYISKAFLCITFFWVFEKNKEGYKNF